MIPEFDVKGLLYTFFLGWLALYIYLESVNTIFLVIYDEVKQLYKTMKNQMVCMLTRFK